MAHETPINQTSIPKWMQHAQRGTDWGIVIAIGFSLIMAWVFLSPNQLSSANDNYPLALKTADTVQALREGRIYPRWSPYANDGYGAPVPHIYPPLIHYTAALLTVLFTNDVPLAMQWVYVFAFLAAGLGMYLFVIEFHHREAGLLASLLYVSSPYLAMQLAHIDGDLPQLMALALLPSVLWAFVRMYRNGQAPDIFYATLIAALLLLTSPLHLFVAFVFIVLLMIFERDKLTRYGILTLLMVIALSTGITAFYWLPALTSISSIDWIVPTVGHTSEFSLLGLIKSLQALDSADLRPHSQLTFGIPVIVGLILSIANTVHSGQDRNFSLAWLLIALYLILSQMFVLPNVTFLFGIAMFCVVLTISALGNLLSRQHLALRLLSWMLILGSVLIISIPIWAAPNPTAPVRDGNLFIRYLQRETPTTYLADVPLDFPHAVIPLSVPTSATLDDEETDFERVYFVDNAQLTQIETESHLSRYRLVADDNAHIIFNYAYFTGWQATLDGQSLETARDDKTGLVYVHIPEGGEGILTIRFGTTTTRTLSWIITVSAIAGLFVVSIWRWQTDNSLIVDATPLLPRLEAFMLIGLLFLFIALQNAPLTQNSIQELQLPANARFDASSAIRVNSSEGLRITGFLINNTAKAGESLDITLYWEAQRDIDTNIVAQIHLLEANTNAIVTSSSRQIPASYPTYYWSTSGYLRDTHTLTIPDNLAADTYFIAVELFNCTQVCEPNITFTNISGTTLNNPLILQDIDIAPN